MVSAVLCDACEDWWEVVEWMGLPSSAFMGGGQPLCRFLMAVCAASNSSGCAAYVARRCIVYINVKKLTSQRSLFLRRRALSLESGCWGSDAKMSCNRNACSMLLPNFMNYSMGYRSASCARSTIPKLSKAT
ncbi:hypothetical protein TcYC6_0026990 [Trypanosoma cruzi]|nr:hypothetical protein TcYC6_0026990 [Trypanosoma cruzi]